MARDRVGGHIGIARGNASDKFYAQFRKSGSALTFFNDARCIEEASTLLGYMLYGHGISQSTLPETLS
jgi:hypothetical protein